MKKLLTAIVLAAALSFGALPVRADPGPVVSWLMNEPASLFDIGMHSLNQSVQESLAVVTEHLDGNISIDRNHSAKTSGAVFNSKKNQIIIYYYAHKHPFNKADCEKTIISARQTVGSVVEGRRPMTGASYVANFFRHANGDKTSAPANYLWELDEIVEISVNLKGGECFGPLVSNDVFYKDE